MEIDQKSQNRSDAVIYICENTPRKRNQPMKETCAIPCILHINITVVKTWNQPGFPTKYNWIKKIWNIYKKKNYSSKNN